MAASWNYADSDEEFVEEQERKFTGKTALLVMIDSTPEMFQSWGEGEDALVPFHAAIKCCQSMWRSKVVSNDKDLVSLVFVGTDNSQNSSSFENLYQLQELSTVTVSMIEQLNAMQNSEDFDGFESKIGSSDKYDLKDAFWLAKIIFDDGKSTSTYQKKIMFFTRNDNPHGGKANLQKEACNKFKDIGKVELNIVAFNDGFDFSKFYSNLLEDESSLIRVDKLNTLMKVVRVKQRLRRPISRSTLELAPGMKIGIGFYSFVRPAKPPREVTISKRTNEPLEKTVTEFRSESGMPVLKSEERKQIEVQGEKAIFTKEEIKQTKDVHLPGVSLLGFINVDDFNQFIWFRSPGYFIHPDEERISGSKDLFVALLKRCHVLKKIALVRMVLSRGRTPKLACLIPSMGDDVFPQGFHVFAVPFSDEIRNYELELKNSPSTNLVELMEKVIKKITNKSFDILEAHNPKLQHRWRDLERIALELPEDDQGEFHDFSEPNEELMLQRLGELPSKVDTEADECSSHFAATKSTTSVIKPKVNMAMEAKHKRLEKLTIVILRDFLESKRVSTNKVSKKADYVAAVYKYFEENGLD